MINIIAYTPDFHKISDIKCIQCNIGNPMFLGIQNNQQLRFCTDCVKTGVRKKYLHLDKFSLIKSFGRKAYVAIMDLIQK